MSLQETAEKYLALPDDEKARLAKVAVKHLVERKRAERAGKEERV